MKLSGLRVLAICLMLASTVGQADYQAGLNAYSVGDYQEAMREWRAITNGSPNDVVPTIYAEAHYAVAKLYWQGEGVARDYFEARKWLIRAAELGHAGAQAKLGFMYTDGLTVDQDYAQALQWFSMAAKGGNVDGLYNLGIFYLYGWGTDADRTMAKQYLASASALGDPDAEKALQQLLAEDDAMAMAEVPALLPPRIVLEELPEEDALQPVPETVAVEVEPAQEDAGISSDETKPEIALPVMRNENWILSQNPDFYTIQVMALSSAEKVYDQIEGYESMAPFALYRLENEGSPLFVLIQGNYETVELARAARDVFPRRVQRPSRVWIRRFEMVQKLIRAEREG